MTVAPRLRQCSFTRLAPYYALPRRTISLPISQLTHLCLEDFESVEDCLKFYATLESSLNCRLNLGRSLSASPVLKSIPSSDLTSCGHADMYEIRAPQLPGPLDITCSSRHNDSFRTKFFPLQEQYYVAPIPVYVTHMQIILFFDKIALQVGALVRRESPAVPQHTTLSLRELHIEDENPLTCVTDTVLRRLSHGSSGRGQHASLLSKARNFQIQSLVALSTMDAFMNMLESRNVKAPIDSLALPLRASQNCRSRYDYMGRPTGSFARQRATN